MINFAKFEIIGRIGEIDARPKVTLLSVCANYRRKGDDDEWQEDSHWNRVSVFSEGQRKHIADRAQVGDLVRIAGRLKDSSYERDGVTHYTTDRIVEEFGILAAKSMPA
ncbi:single-stranded DNA-binding protein (plasmid) [Sphingobium sp. JS3065]|uniref:single-stranded DNA-binding protein n=1 Tax=Sphingobium sp. JS3065 TaxID=2970925 RepID=UPI002264DD36|nr:single-stranded DNA-binding protein [Sphingobium sp. JS3065]UZW58258.1 single-stranded DNA-binding protein [Sphingobium sp. JS3065]